METANKEEYTLEKCIDLINYASSGSKAMSFTKEISSFHRIQASQGYRDAAKSAAELLLKNGIPTSIRSYPADGKAHYFTQKSFKEWNCSEGWLKLISPWFELLSDFQREEISIIQRSANMDFSNKEVPIIFVEDSVVPKDFNTSLEGALLFVENNFDKWFERALELQALGIITVSMPEIDPVRLNISEDKDLANAHANLSFHLYSEDHENKLCGFAISPSKGKKLIEACKTLGDRGLTPMASFKISANLEQGFIENVDAIVQGETDEEILIVAHLCHPRSSVNDNASGGGAAMEAICTLNRLISSGDLPPLKRSIRLLLIPEFTGTYAFLKENEDRLSNIVSGINLDMVGAYQNEKSGPMIIVDTPDSAYSFSGDLSSIILDKLSKECKFGANGYVPLFNGIKVPFTTGSDHYILSDPTIDIPSVAITQWPDKSYHTSADNLGHIDPKMLCRAAVLAASYAYIYSRFNLEDAKKVLAQISIRFVKKLTILRNKDDCKDMKECCEYIKDIYFGTLDKIPNLLDGDDKDKILLLIEKEKEFFLKLIQISFEPSEDKESFIENSSRLYQVPVRLFKGPIAKKCVSADLGSEEKEKLNNLYSKYPGFSFLDDYIIYEVDGIKTVGYISQRVYYQTGKECKDYAHEFLDILSHIGLVKFK